MSASFLMFATGQLPSGRHGGPTLRYQTEAPHERAAVRRFCRVYALDRMTRIEVHGGGTWLVDQNWKPQRTEERE